MSMYLDHFGLSEPPFRITPQTAWFFGGAQRGALLDALLYAIEHDEGIVKISGEVGVGKTMLCRMIIERLPGNAQVIYIANPSLSPEALLSTFAVELGISDATGQSLLRRIEEALIERYAGGQRVVAIIDEAHAMPAASLEQVRLLSNLETSNRKLLQLVLFGQPELDDLLARHEMRSLHDRITQHFVLEPLREREVSAYLAHRLEAAGYRGPDLFRGKTIGLITAGSKGLIRRINILADKTLMAAFSENTRNVTTHHVRQAIADARYSLPAREQMGTPLLLAIGALCGLVGAGMIGWYAARHQAPAASQGKRGALEETSREPGQLQRNAAPASAPDLPGDASEPQARASRTGDEGAISVEALLEQSWERIAAAQAGHYFIQLQRVSGTDRASLQAFVTRASAALGADGLRLYRVSNGGGVRYGVIFGDYASAREAADAIAALPAWVRQTGAYARQYSALKGVVD